MPRSGVPTRVAVFAALREVLLEKPWAKVTLEAVAKRAGVSRQTIYNDFGSRAGLAEAYAFDLADAFCDFIDADMRSHADHPTAALAAAMRTFLDGTSGDPLIRRVQAGDAHPDLVRLVTTDSGGLLAHIAGRLTTSITEVWPKVDPMTAQALSRIIARFGFSYVAMPPETDDDVAVALAALLAPALVAAVAGTLGRGA
ncbi:TetR/AcrR family transcriptional regulator [Nocardioides humilatus]|uniref:TetR/AcrR family transcriptional regulator n=1 Tax=Nocardioides humilatus TaxID=2607660 RepID=A0A5B1LAM1_9ACTN|nr:TetR/AcrR family transcriptional regulator [Nocardioides humilatus]KAA1417685.1 TetR/AcrR family transcriptional regulator [Nocardioides humilatus]